jgi:hypothetical protein
LTTKVCVALTGALRSGDVMVTVAEYVPAVIADP